MPLLSAAASLIGGGAIITAVINQVAARKQRRIETLRAELQEFYGPLGFLAAATRMMSDHRSKLVNTAMQTATHPDDDPAMAIRRSEEAAQAIEVGFDFNQSIAQRNEEVHELLRKQYHLIDPADLELFHSIMLDLERMKVEAGPHGASKLPISAHVQAVILVYTRDEFTDRVKARLDEKQRLLDRLSHPWWRRRFSGPGRSKASIRGQLKGRDGE
jgi:hypothetical protein